MTRQHGNTEQNIASCDMLHENMCEMTYLSLNQPGNNNNK